MWPFNRRCRSRHVHHFTTRNLFSGVADEHGEVLRCQNRRDHPGQHWSYYFHERNVAEWED